MKQLFIQICLFLYFCFETSVCNYFNNENFTFEEDN